MQHDNMMLLEDIRQASEKILEFTHGKTLSKYQQDSMCRSAVERQFEIIGESLNRLYKSDPDTASKITNYSRIIAFKNILIHGYDVVEDAVVWDIISDYLPGLYEQVLDMLK